MAARKVRFNGLMWAAWWPMAVLAGDPCGGNPDAWGPVTVGASDNENDCATQSLQTAIDLATDPSQCYSNTVHVMRDAPSAGSNFFDGGNILIRDKNVTVIGGWVNHPGTCVLQQETPGDAYTVIDGAGGSSDSVFRIEGNSSVRLSRLTIQNGGGPSTDFGGGIRFWGSGHLFLDHVDLVNNSAARGGGMYLVGPNLSTHVGDRVWVMNNSASYGGGIYTYFATLDWTGNNAKLWSNMATYDGGGLHAGFQAVVMLTPLGEYYPPTGAYHAVISANEAGGNGGGIAADATSGVPFFWTQSTAQYVVIGSHDAAHAQFIANNTAGGNGGALYQRSRTLAEHGGATFSSIACLGGTGIVNNEARQGGAVYLGSDAAPGSNDGSFELAGSRECAGRDVLSCPDCNVIYINRSTEGSVIQSEAGPTTLEITHTVLSGNTGTSLISSEGSTDLTLNRNLIALNTSEQPLIATYGLPALVQINHNTIADNVIAGNRVLETDLLNTTSSSEISRNIIWQPGKEVVGSPLPIPYGLVHQNLTNDSTLLQLGPWNQTQITVADLFDPGQAYFPAAYSKALDWGEYEPALRPEFYPDLAGRPIRDLLYAHGRDSTTAVADLGAYERQTEAPGVDVFSDSFETN